MIFNIKTFECIICYWAEALRDLIRFLRKDDESYEIRKHLGYAKILQTDLLPILIHHHNDAELLDLLLRYIVTLSSTFYSEYSLLYSYTVKINLCYFSCLQSIL